MGDCSDLAWDGEHDMAIGHRQKIGFKIVKPLLAPDTLAIRATPVSTCDGRSTLPTATGTVPRSHEE